jgi:hypothetical protein
MGLTRVSTLLQARAFETFILIALDQAWVFVCLWLIITASLGEWRFYLIAGCFIANAVSGMFIAMRRMVLNGGALHVSKYSLLSPWWGVIIVITLCFSPHTAFLDVGVLFAGLKGGFSTPVVVLRRLGLFAMTSLGIINQVTFDGTVRKSVAYARTTPRVPSFDVWPADSAPQLAVLFLRDCANT